MLENYYERKKAFERIKNSPLGLFTDEIAAYLQSQNRTIKYAHRFLSNITNFAFWFKENGISIKNVTFEHAESYLSERYAEQHNIPSSSRSGIKFAIELVHKKYPPKRTPCEKEADLFLMYLRNDRGWCKRYAVSCTKKLVRFFRSFFGDGKVELRSMTPVMIENYIEMIPWSRANGARKEVATTLRQYFIYRKLSRKPTYNLELGIPVITGLPRTVSPNIVTVNELNILLNSVDRTTSDGLATYAMILCLHDLGLRSIDVSRITLDDFSWRSGMIRIPSTKNSTPFILPLTQRVGKAIVDYIQHGRPKSTLRRLFLRKPCNIVLPTNSCCIRYKINCQWVHAGLHDQFSGTHILRHTVASNLVQEGFPLKLIADVLNHRSIDSTAIYAQIDIPSLRQVARPWPDKVGS